MAQDQTVFEYIYVPYTRRMHPDDGGFRVALMGSGMLVFQQVNASRQVLENLSFQLQPEISTRIRHLIGRSMWWINSMQSNGQPWFRPDGQAECSSDIRLETAMFRMEDIPQLMECPFRQLRGHYSRMMYNLLEDISTVLLRTAAIDLTLTGFTWDPRFITPLEYQPQQPPMPENQQMFGA